MNPRDVVIFRVTSIHDASAPSQWAGKSGSGASAIGLMVGIPQRSPVGLHGWKSREDARKALDLWLGLSTIIGGCPFRYEMVVFGPPEPAFARRP